MKKKIDWLIDWCLTKRCQNINKTIYSICEFNSAYQLTYIVQNVVTSEIEIHVAFVTQFFFYSCMVIKYKSLSQN